MMMVKDEADVIGTTIRHLLAHVDEVIVADNGSTDGTLEIIRACQRDEGRVFLEYDWEVGYFQSRKMTILADMARERGHDWVVPCDADEIWHVEIVERSISSWLNVQAQNVGIVTAELFDHVPTALDRDDGFSSPFEIIRWRRRAKGGLPKVAARLLPGLVIEQGNHGAHYPGGVATSSGLAVRHFPYRSVEQFVRKVVNGAAAYAVTDLPWSMGQHWREYGQHYERGGEDAIREIFETWFYSADPTADRSLIMDPAPLRAVESPRA